MKKSADYTLSDHLVIFLMAFGTLVLRLYFPDDFSFSNDELSALIRIQYQNVSELLQKGVIETDPHPAGVQIFLFYYVKWFGDSEWVVRFPFVLAGATSLFPFFYALRHWMSGKAAILATSFLAFSIICMQLGQVARPYSFGLLFSLTLFYAWTKFHFHKNALPIWPWIGMIVSASLCLYTHYFAALMAFIIGVTALFSSRSIRKRWVIYFGLAVLLLYLPHFNIFLAQTGKEDITGWLPMPKWNFILEHMFVLLNESLFLVIVVIVAIIFGLFQKGDAILERKFGKIAIFWFLAPVVVSYVYSVFKGAVLMDRVLLFSAPYFYALISTWVVRNKSAWMPIFVILVLLTDTFFIQQYFATPFTENFKAIAHQMEKNEKNYSPANMLRLGNFNDLRYIEHYRNDSPQKFDATSINRGDSLFRLIELMEQAEQEYVETSWACVNQPYEVPEIVKMYFPNTVENLQYYNSGYALYQKDNSSRDTLLWQKLSVEDTVILDENQEYVFTRKFNVDSLRRTGMDAITFWCRFEALNQNGSEAVLVMSFEDPAGENQWYGIPISKFKQKGRNKLALITRKLPEDMSSAAKLVVYLWNHQKGKIQVIEPTVSAFQDSQYDFYPF